MVIVQEGTIFPQAVRYKHLKFKSSRTLWEGILHLRVISPFEMWQYGVSC